MRVVGDGKKKLNLQKLAYKDRGVKPEHTV